VPVAFAASVGVVAAGAAARVALKRSSAILMPRRSIFENSPS
jgi:hypothetical protein